MEPKVFVKNVADYLTELSIPFRLDFKSDLLVNTSFKTNDESDDDVFLVISLLVDELRKTVQIYERVRIKDTDVNLKDYANTFIKPDTNDNEIPISVIIEKIQKLAVALGYTLIKTNDIKQTQFPETFKSSKVIPTSKKPSALILVAAVALVVVVAVVIFVLKKPQSQSPTLGSTSDSAVVSAGVNEKDLGNIMNGQYYFATDTHVFYSSFDTNNKSHIYSAKKNGSDLKSIFNGFGWSLVVIDDWLYFSGNQGDQIDGTYHIFRIKTDGSKLEEINDRYSYGMFLYGDYLYYMTSNIDYPSSMSVARSKLDGSNKEILFDYGYSPVVYKKLLYHFDNQGNLIQTKPDGTDQKVLITAEVKSYAISNDKIVYNDFANNIKVANLDGSNVKTIRQSHNEEILNVNTYDGRIYFSEYDPNFNYSIYGYDYTIYSCKMDGSDEKALFSSTSYGIYMNIVNNKLMLMDYTRATNADVMSAIIKVMNLDGSNVQIMDR